MRIAHVTDIHVQVPPRLGELFNKRFLGAANLYVAGRKSHFTQASQAALVRSLEAQPVDVIACTGDLTALATEAEFEAALELLGPRFSAQPTVLIPGNHDTYTPQVCAERHIERLFGQWTGQGDWPRLHRVGPLAFVCVDVCRARMILSTGTADRDQLERLDALLEGLEAEFTFVMLHYPLRDRRGQPYGPDTRNITNAAEIEAVLTRHSAKVGAVLHGHEHHGFRVELTGGQRPIPILNPGAAGYAHLPDEQRTAHYCVYTVTEGRLQDIERFTFDGQAFAPEPGGAWASGR
jgi:3',5'-cyclic AMP phosphodiesterase CpdA